MPVGFMITFDGGTEEQYWALHSTCGSMRSPSRG